MFVVVHSVCRLCRRLDQQNLIFSTAINVLFASLYERNMGRMLNESRDWERSQVDVFYELNTFIFTYY